MNDISQMPTSSSGSKGGVVTIIISILVILLLVFFMIAALNFMGLIPLKKVAPGVFDWLPVNNITSEDDSEPQTVMDDETGFAVKSSSDIPGFSLIINDEEGLMDMLNEIGVFGENHQDSFGGSTGTSPIKTVNITLTDVEMPEHPYANEKIGGTFLSTKSIATPGEVTVMVFIHPDILNDPEQDLGSYVQTGFITGIYRFVNRIEKSGDSARIRAGVDKLIVDMAESKKFFSVRK